MWTFPLRISNGKDHSIRYREFDKLLPSNPTTAPSSFRRIQF